MPSFSAMTLNGIAGADHVFAPYGLSNNANGGVVATWYKSGTTPIGDEKVTVSATRLPNGRYKWLATLAIPKTEVVDGKDTLLRTGRVSVEIVTESTHTAVERGELLDLLRSVISDADGPLVAESLVFNRPFY